MVLEELIADMNPKNAQKFDLKYCLICINSHASPGKAELFTLLKFYFTIYTNIHSKPTGKPRLQRLISGSSFFPLKIKVLIAFKSVMSFGMIR